MQRPMETWLGECFVTFDGRVVETFSRRANLAGRVHVATIDRLSIERSRGELYIQAHLRPAGTALLAYFPNEQLHVAQWLVSAIEAAGANYR